MCWLLLPIAMRWPDHRDRGGCNCAELTDLGLGARLRWLRQQRRTALRLDADPGLGSQWLEPRITRAAQYRRTARARLLLVLRSHVQSHAGSPCARGWTTLADRASLPGSQGRVRGTFHHYEVRPLEGWYRHITLAVGPLRVLAIARGEKIPAGQGAQRTRSAICHHLLWRGWTALTLLHVLQWRRRHQFHAIRCHYRKRGSPLPIFYLQL